MMNREGRVVGGQYWIRKYGRKRKEEKEEEGENLTADEGGQGMRTD